MKYLLVGILFLILVSSIFRFILFSEAAAQDKVQLGLFGHWSNNYDDFRAVEVMEGEVFGEYGDPEATYAFCATSKGMAVFSVRPKVDDPNSRTQEVSLVSFVPIDDCTDITIQIDERGNEKNIYTYISAGTKGLYIRNITNPAFSYYLGSCDTPGSAQAVAVSSDYAYVADGENGLHVIDISKKNAPAIVGSCDILGSAKAVAVSGDYAYVADGENGLQVIDIRDKKGPAIVGSCDTSGSAKGVEVSGDYAYVADGENGLQVIDIRNKNGPVIVGKCDTHGSARGITVSGNYAYVADYRGGLQVIDIRDKNSPVIVGNCDTPGGAVGVAVSGDYAYVADLEDIIETENSSLKVIDIRDKNGPVIAGNCDTPDWAYGIAVSGDYAYVADRGGLQVINIQDKNGPVIVGSCNIPGRAKGVAVSGDYAYVVDDIVGLHVIDIRDKNGPAILGSCDTQGDTEEVVISGDYAYVVGSGLHVIDIRDKNGPVIVGSCPTPGYAYGVAVSGDYAYVAAGYGDLQVINIQDKNGPVIVGSCNIPGRAKGVAVSGDYAYVVDDIVGLHVIDILDKNGPVIAGNCDTPSGAYEIAVFGDNAYVADGGSGLQVIDIRDKNGPAIVGSCGTPSWAFGVAVSGGYAYVADGGSGLQVIDIQDKNGSVIVGSCDAPNFANGVAVSCGYAYVADYRSGLQVIDIQDKNGPVIVRTCDTHGPIFGVVVSGDYAYADTDEGGLYVIDIRDKNGPVIVGICDTVDLRGIAVSGDYAYVADGGSGLQVIDIRDKNRPAIVGSCDTPGSALAVAVSGDYAYVADYEISLQVIDIRDKNGPAIVGSCGTADQARGVAVSGDYAYVADYNKGLQVIDIRNKNGPVIVGTCDTIHPVGIAVSGYYAYVADWGRGLQVIDIHDPNAPVIVGSSDTLGLASGIAVSGDYAYIADRENGLLQFKIQPDPSPQGKGNLILVAGGDINYKVLSQQRAKTNTRQRLKSSPLSHTQSTPWQITRALATHVFNTFRSNGYDVCDIYYFNPDPLQDIDNDGITNQLIVDDSTPTPADLIDIIKNWPEGHIANEGPLYIYLIGQAAEDRFLMMSDQIITASELKYAIDCFQNGYTDEYDTYHPGTNRRVVVVIESAASGTFIDELSDPNISVTVITSTGTGASYTKPSSDPDCPYQGFTTAFIDAYAPSLDPNSIPEGTPEEVSSHITQSLKTAFLSARNTLETSGHPFTDQAPQMALPQSPFSAIHFSEDGIAPVAQGPLAITSFSQDIPLYLTLIGEDPNHTYHPIPQETHITFFSSNTHILDPLYDIQNEGDWYVIAPQKNGLIRLIAHADPNSLPLSAKLSIEVSIDTATHPEYALDTNRMAIIVAGYKGTGDYLWESTNTIANHAYQTFRAMGYTKDEIHYYNPFFLQDLDDNKTYDDIEGYPEASIFDPNASSPFAEIMDSDTGINELLIFLADHGNKGTFTINPKEPLYAHDLIDQIESIQDKVNDKIVLLYDACYSGSFLEEIEQRTAIDPELTNKLLTITSTDPNQIAYFLNQGLVSFSYPFLDEWRLTHSLKGAFDYAGASLPYTDPNQGQTPCISDPALADTWDQETIYYVNESRPIFGEVSAYRTEGNLHINADIFSLTGIAEVWAIVESSQNSMRSTHREAVTEATLFFLSPSDPNTATYGGEYILTTPDPCPTEATYLISLYARDKSSLPKVASYHTGIRKTAENTTKALIISSDPAVLQEGLRSKFQEQLTRAQIILESRGLDFYNGDILPIKGEDIESTEELSQIFSDIPPLDKEQTLFVYLLGQVIDAPDTTPCFFLNPNILLTPEWLRASLPWANQRLLILMDTPYAHQFLSSFDPNHTHDNWAGIASTDQAHLFFPLEGRPYPCYSNFFFSLVLSGATVSQAHRMAQNAVSLTRQRPGIFLPEEAQTYQIINRHLNYYLGTSAIHGEDYTLFTDCRAQRLPGTTQYQLTFRATADALINRAWAFLTSPSDLYRKSLPVDFDTNAAYIDGNSLYTATVSTGDSYYNASFLVEGCLQSDTQKTWTEWQETAITQEDTNIIEDPYEPNDDPNTIGLDQIHEIIVNAPPQRRTFYAEYIDWAYFYAQEGHIYELYAQDLSEYGYFIQLAIFSDPNTILKNENSQELVANNYLAFSCKESGYYLLRVTLASTYPPQGVEYILGITDPRAEKFTNLLVEVIDPVQEREPGVRCLISGNTSFIGPDNYLCKSPGQHQYRFNELVPYTGVLIQVYEGTEFLGAPIAETTAWLLRDTQNTVTIDLTGQIPPNIIPRPHDTSYDDEIKVYPQMITNEQYTWDANNPLPFGDMDPNFPPYGDFDGDGISNVKEALFYRSSPIYPTVVIPLHRGMNLFYLPSVAQVSNIISIDNNDYPVYRYRAHSMTWEEPPLSLRTLTSNAFNAIHAPGQASLCLELTELNNPVLCLRGFLKPGYSLYGNPDPLAFLYTNLVDPNCFCTDASSREILVNPTLSDIESISSRNEDKGKWDTGYRFYKRPAGANYCFKPYEVYIVYRKGGVAP